MKIFILTVFLLLFINIFSLFPQNPLFEGLDIKRINTNFNGSAYNGSSILAYGEAGVILRSSDLGKDWEQIQINDSLNILEIINIGKNFYGIASNKYVITSDDDGLNWTLKDFGDSSKFYKILNHSNKLYLILDKKIWVLNKNLEKIREYSFYTDSSYYDAEIVGNKLIYSAGKGKLGVFDLQYNTQDSIDLTKYGVCKECPVPTKLISNRTNLLYFLLGAHFYQYDFSNNTASFVFKPMKISNSDFFAYDNDLYHIYSVSFEDKHIDSLYFGKVNKNNNNFINLKRELNDRYIYNVRIKDLMFIEKDIIIAVGKGKLIYMSYDCGNNWELKSLISEMNRIHFFDRMNAVMMGYYVQFTYTKDGGVTWLPQKNHSDRYYLESALNFPELVFFKDKKNGIYISDPLYMKIKNNVAITKDGGETVELKSLEEYQNLSQNKPLITKYKNNYLVVTYRDINNKESYLIFDFINENAEILKRKTFKDLAFYFITSINDTLYAIGKNLKNTSIKDYKIYFSSDEANTWNELFSLQIDTINIICEPDNMFSNNIGYKFFLHFYCYTIPKDNISNKIFMIDIYKKEVKEIVNNYFYIPPCINKIKNKFYYFHNFSNRDSIINEECSTSCIDDEIIQWVCYPILRYSELIYYPSFLQSDSLFAFAAYDSLFSSQELFFASYKNSTDVENIFDTEILTPFYISQVYPTPANDFVKFNIFFDRTKFDIENAEIKIYNLLGLQINSEKEINILQNNSYSAEFIWSPIIKPNKGVYIVNIKCGIYNFSKQVLFY